MNKEKIKHEIEKLSEKELEELYAYISYLRKHKKSKLNLRSLHLKDKLDQQDLRSMAPHSWCKCPLAPGIVTSSGNRHKRDACAIRVSLR